MAIEAGIEAYLARLDKALGQVAISEKASIIMEIKSHILDARERNPKLSLNSVLESLGEPESIANRFLVEKGLPLGKPAKSPIVKWLVIGCLGALGIFCFMSVMLIWIIFGALKGGSQKVSISDQGVIVSSNGTSINISDGKANAPKLSQADLDRIKKLEGWYQAKKDPDFWQLQYLNGALHVKGVWGEADMVPLSATEFVVGQWEGSKFVFETGKDGSPKGFKDIKNGKLNKEFIYVDPKKK